MLNEGIIVKGIAGFYYIRSQNHIIECKARGKFRNNSIIPLVGDRVRISINDSNMQGTIEEIMPRDTELIRPPVANVNHAVIVFAAKQPEPNLYLLDRFLVMAESKGIAATICFNKIDLDDANHIKKLASIYESAGYRVISISAKMRMGIENLRNILKDRISVFAGPSGVGKSSLLNAVQPNLALKTGEISRKNEKGKHTTRHVELLELEFGGWVVDTPGFSSLSIDFIAYEDLQYYFREFMPLIGQCKFKGCMHMHEPDCIIKAHVLNGDINKSRYESYVQLLDEIKQNRRY